MREIKFRAWDGKQMYISPSTLEDLHHLGSWFEAHSAFRYTPKESENAIIMQYTGLKDKNGKEIYEGDIMSTGHGWSNYTVVFEDGSFCFGNDQPNGADRLSQDRVGRLEVIGNIYETPTP